MSLPPIHTAGPAVDAAPLAQERVALEWGSRFRAARRGLWPALRESVFHRVAMIGSMLALVAGLGMPGLLSFLLPPSALSTGPTSAGLGSSYVLNLVLLGVMMTMLPLGAQRGWVYLASYLRVMTWSLTAYAGLGLSPWAGVSFSAAASLFVLTIAQGLALCGAAAVLDIWSGKLAPIARMGWVLAFSLLAGSLLWTKPVLIALKKYDYENQIRDPNGMGTRWATHAQNVIMALGPPTAVSSVWNAEGAGFDLIMGPNTYRIWVGSWVIPYTKLWPGRAGGAYGSDAKWTPGLVLALSTWGLVLVLGVDLLAWLDPRCGSEKDRIVFKT